MLRYVTCYFVVLSCTHFKQVCQLAGAPVGSAGPHAAERLRGQRQQQQSGAVHKWRLHESSSKPCGGEAAAFM